MIKKAAQISLFFFSFLFCVLLLITGYIFFQKSNADFHSKLLSWGYGKEVRTEGVLDVELRAASILLSFKDWQARDMAHAEKRSLVSVQDGHVKLWFWPLFIGKIFIQDMDLKTIKIAGSQSMKPINVSSWTKKGNEYDFKAQLGDVSASLQVNSKDNKLTGQLGEIILSASYGNGLTDLKEFKIENGESIYEGAYKKSGKRHMLFLDFDANNALDLMYKSKQNEHRIVLKSDQFDLKDIQVISNLIEDVNTVVNKIMISNAGNTEHSKGLKFITKLDRVVAYDRQMGRVHGLVSQDKRALIIEPYNVDIAGASLVGKGIISFDPENSSLLKFKWLGFDFASIRTLATKEYTPSNVKGDVKIELVADGGSYDSFKQTLDGSVSLKLNEGKIGTGLINLWGGGVINSLIPSFKDKEAADLNCAWTYVGFENGKGRIKPLVFDTDRVTLYGKGWADLPANTLDLVVKPKPKGVTLGNISTALRVSGPIDKPSFSLDKMSALKKLGGIALGVVNPTFFLFSLNDLGLDEQDVCSTKL